MATEIYTTRVIRLQDEEEVELRPLPISKLRKFTRMWSDHMKEVTAKIVADEAKPEEDRDLDQADLTDAQYTVFIKMCALGLEGQLKGEKTEKQFLAYLEEVLDDPTIYVILEVTGGLKFGNDNPNPQTPETRPGDGKN